MNYFELYEIPVSFLADEILIKQKYYANSKKYHPDFFINESEDKQAEVLHLSTLNNEAYRLLTDFDKRVAYILTLNGQISDAEKFVLPPDFLMKMMDINEKMMELSANDLLAITDVTNEIAILEKSLNDYLQASCKQFDAHDHNDQESVLLAIKDAYYRKKYLLRIKDSLNKFAS
jgi:molecular chaperone HscB